MATIGGIEFNLLDEDRQYDSEVTTHPVENNADIAEHIELSPLVYSITGIVTGDDASEKHLELIRLRRSKELIEYRGRANMKNCVIERYNTSVDASIADGFNFSATIREIRVARPSTVGLLPATLRADTSEIGNAGRVQAQ